MTRNILFGTLAILCTLVYSACANVTSIVAPDCLHEPLPDGAIEWQNHVHGSAIVVEWGFGNQTCNSLNSCFALSLDPDTNLEAQLPPIQVQRGVTIRFVASNSLDVPFEMIPHRVDKAAFRRCNTSTGVALVDNFTSEEITVPTEMLEIGSNYFIVETTDLLYKCQFGLRLNISVKQEQCHGTGDTSKCGDKGRCVSDIHQVNFSCRCCEGYNGAYCQDADGCQDNPCRNNATCYSLGEDSQETKFGCACPDGFYGDLCDQEIENMCELNQCVNNGTCIGDKQNYTCACAHGYQGHHCEIDVNDCAMNPCDNGICVDKPDGHDCYCKPGYTGDTCSTMLPHCDANHCQHAGVCIDSETGAYCHCTRGYIGPDCSVNVDLCEPSPCVHETECVDLGSMLACTCEPGYTGVHCEININECMSDPCHYGGRCIDMVAAFRCICPSGIHGAFCQYAKHGIPEHEYEGIPFDSPWRHRTPLQNLSIVAGTLGGAVLLAAMILAGCYCKVHETYKQLYCGRKVVCNGYRRQVNDATRTCIQNSSLVEARPSLDAILEATSSDYDQNQLNNPVLASLKPKRV